MVVLISPLAYRHFETQPGPNRSERPGPNRLERLVFYVSIVRMYLNLKNAKGTDGKNWQSAMHRLVC